jgi:hypothetical protein
MSKIENKSTLRTWADLSDEEKDAWERSQTYGQTSADSVVVEEELMDSLRKDRDRLADVEASLADGMKSMSRAILILAAVGAALVLVMASILVVIIVK